MYLLNNIKMSHLLILILSIFLVSTSVSQAKQASLIKTNDSAYLIYMDEINTLKTEFLSTAKSNPQFTVLNEIISDKTDMFAQNDIKPPTEEPDIKHLHKNIKFNHAVIDLRLLSIKILKAMAKKKLILKMNSLAVDRDSQLDKINSDSGKIAETLSNHEKLTEENKMHEMEYNLLEQFYDRIKALQNEIEKFQLSLSEKLADSSRQ